MPSAICQYESDHRTQGAPLRLRRPASATRSSLLAPRSFRRGISLLEVLISMFVLLFGLMGVAAIFPVGNHYAGKGDQYDRGAALAGSAFAEVKARGLLNPRVWIYADGTSFINSNGWFNTADPGLGFVIDPIGASAPVDDLSQNNFFPYGALAPGWTTAPASTAWPLRRVTFATPDPTSPFALIRMPSAVAQAVFQLRDDLAVELPKENDHPGIQRWAVDNNGTKDDPTDDIPLNRAFVGSYSWLATVVPTSANNNPAIPDAHQGLQPADPRYGSFLYDVSVAVFYKRETTPGFDTERILSAELGPGGDLVMFDGTGDIDVVDAAVEDIRGGRWILLAGVHPNSGKFLLRWYRLLSIDDETEYVPSIADPTITYDAGRTAMVEGPEWPMTTDASGRRTAAGLRAILLPGVIGVTTQTVKLNEE
jgi:hypothetical protein